MRWLLATTLLFACPGWVLAEEPTLEQQVQTLQKELEELRYRLSQQEQATSGGYLPAADHGATTVYPWSDEAAPNDPLLETPGYRGPPVLTEEYDFSQAPACEPESKKGPKVDFGLTGFFQFDSAWHHQDEEDRFLVGDIQDGGSFRRARLAGTAVLEDRARMLIEFDFAQAAPRFADVWGQLDDTAVGNIRIGRFRQPFGMTEMTSVRNLSFLERPAPFALTPFRQTGIMLFDTAFEERATWGVSAFHTISDNFGNVYGDSGGVGTAERFTALAYEGDHLLMHVGFGHSYLDPARNQLQFAYQPEVFIHQNATQFGPPGLSVLPLDGIPPFVNTGVFPLEYANLINLEYAARWDKLAFQSEYRWSNLQLFNGDNVTVYGGYAELRYALIGDPLPYDRQNGVFGTYAVPKDEDVLHGGLGVIEIAGRISRLNLNPLSGEPGVPGIAGTGLTGDLRVASAIVNWYFIQHGKLQAGYLHANGEYTNGEASGTDSFISRVQFDF